MDREVIIRAQLAALLSFGGKYHPLNSDQALLIAITAIEMAASESSTWNSTLEDAQNRLTLRGIIALCHAQAGSLPRELLIERIESLPKDQQVAYSLRYEHNCNDLQIAHALGLSEDQVVTIMLKALMTLTGQSNGDTGN